ncbi:hypothetical protein Fmac_015283 [Flemingia macrophylla]|uniref:Uncharacterized protein n=1 Tax=Flemingia macrophylla TaxID=520843 RepID=A0ABD1MG86_9FABA
MRIRSLPLLQESAASVLPMTTILVSVLLRNNLEWMSILRLMLQTSVADHHSSRDKALDREDGSQLLQFGARNDAIIIRGLRIEAASIIRVCGIRSSNGHHTSLSVRNDAIVMRRVHDVATDTSAKTRKLEGKLDAFVNLLTQLVANQKASSVARVYSIRSSNSHHTSVYHSSQSNLKKLEGKLNALVNLLTQLAMNQKPASVARVCSIHSSKDHHTSVLSFFASTGMDEHPEAYAANTYSRPPDQQRRGI